MKIFDAFKDAAGYHYSIQLDENLPPAGDNLQKFDWSPLPLNPDTNPDAHKHATTLSGGVLMCVVPGPTPAKCNHVWTEAEWIQKHVDEITLLLKPSPIAPATALPVKGQTL